MNRTLLLLLFALPLMFTAYSCASDDAGTKETEDQPKRTEASSADTLRLPQERYLRNVRQLTFGGDNAEAYFSFDNTHLVYQYTSRDSVVPCDQIFAARIPAPGQLFEPKMVSMGLGRTTCAYYYPDNQRIIYASTHPGGDECPPEPDRSKIRKYVWPIYDTYELFVYDPATGEHTRLTDNTYYDAEATVSPRGDKVLFTSDRTGDLELYTMDLDGSNVRQITDRPGYCGGAFFGPDGDKVVFRATVFQSEEEKTEYYELLKQGLVAPGQMEIFVCDADGSNLVQVTNLGMANWAPFFHPSGNKILFSSNHHTESGRQFNLWMVNLDGSGLEQVTFDRQFDAFPMFSFDGKYLVWSSNRNNGDTRDTNVFIAEWVEDGVE